MEKSGIEASVHNEQVVLQDKSLSSDDATRNIASVVSQFIVSYREHKDSMSLSDWLGMELKKNLQSETDDEIQKAVQQIIATTQSFESKTASLESHMANGDSETSWMVKELEAGSAAAGTVSVGTYGARIDMALNQANANARSVIMTNSDKINQGFNLDGFIAEQHHADTFNIDAAVKDSAYHAEVKTPGSGETYGKNSMDIGVYDENNKLVGRYQSKYGRNPEATAQAFEHGDYRGQQKLVPEGQAAEIEKKSVEYLEADGVRSQPLSKEEAKDRQRKAQQDGESHEYDWKDADTLEAAKSIGKQALLSVAMTLVFKGIGVVIRRSWNAIRGYENPDIKEEIMQFLGESLSSAGRVGLITAISGAFLVAAKKGWLGAVLEGVGAGVLTNVVCIAMDQVKTLYKLGSGELTPLEAMNQMSRSASISVATIIATTEAAAVGATLGGVFGPVGMLVGAMVAGTVAGVATSTVGQYIMDAREKIIDLAKNCVTSILDMASSSLESVAYGINAFKESIFG